MTNLGQQRQSWQCHDGCTPWDRDFHHGYQRLNLEDPTVGPRELVGSQECRRVCSPENDVPGPQTLMSTPGVSRGRS